LLDKFDDTNNVRTAIKHQPGIIHYDVPKTYIGSFPNNRPA